MCNINIENKIVDDYINEEYVTNIVTTIVIHHQCWSRECIPRLLNTSYNKLISDKMWMIIKKYKNPIIDFNLLQKTINIKIKELKPELF